MNSCSNCGLIIGLHGSILPGCMCSLKPQNTLKPDWDEKDALVDAMQRMAKQIEALQQSPMEQPSHTINAAKTVAVATDVYWLPIETAPRGVKLQLCNKKSGVATYGICAPKELYFDFWSPLPKFNKD